MRAGVVATGAAAASVAAVIAASIARDRRRSTQPMIGLAGRPPQTAEQIMGRDDAGHGALSRGAALTAGVRRGLPARRRKTPKRPLGAVVPPGVVGH